MADRETLLVTDNVAALLQVHPKQVYRLLARGLPARRVGREWRFDRAEVLRWVDGGAEPEAVVGPPVESPAPPLLAANGDLAVELLLAGVAEKGPVIGSVPRDRDGGLALLRSGRVLLAGCHGREPPEQIGETRLARVHLVLREVGLVAPGGAPVPDRLAGLRFAGRPRTAGITVHLEGVDLSGAAVRIWGSHREVVHAVVRGEADVGLATRAWADRVGLSFRALAVESYGLVLRARDLGDPRVVRVCEVAQSASFREALAAIPGYDPASSGAVQFHFGP